MSNMCKFNKVLAYNIGLKEAIIIQQIDDWCKYNKNNNKNYKDGYYWTYNSIKKWNEILPFISESTIKRILKKLKDKKIIVTGNYNKKKYDNTIWYRIDHDILDDISNKPIGQNDLADSTKMIQSIPLYKNSKEDNDFLSQFFDDDDFNDNDTTTQNKNSDDISNFINTYMNKLYFKYTNKYHPSLKNEQYKRVFNTLYDFLCDYNLEYNDLILMAERFFNINIETDYNINHFATEGILENRFREVI